MIPAEFRRTLGLSDGATVVITETEDGDLRLSTPSAGLRRARELVRRYVPPVDDLVDELLAERREQAAHE